MKLFVLDMSVASAASLLAVLFPSLTRELLRTHIPQKNFRQIAIVLIFMLGICVSKAFATYIRIKWGHILGVRMEADMRSDVFGHLQKLSFTYYDNV